MQPVELLWPPHPYRAGFCVTDDADSSELATVRIVYDFLSALSFRTTRTVWAFRPSEPCGLPGLPDSIQRGVTLEDPDYLGYCRELDARGFEIALHGASAGNNRREQIARAFELMDRNFTPAGTYICHAKNADNPYWQEKVVARGPLRALLAPYAGRHRCSGEDPVSPYFWGDLCRERVRYIRLFRTARVNTLAANPSLPYFEREKPFVGGWFTATKRSFRDCTAEAALDALERDFGLCVLYQYLCRYADPARGAVKPAFREGAGRLRARRAIWVDTTSRILDRLRLVQGVLVAARGRELWLVNANREEIGDLQLLTRVELASPVPPGVRAGEGIVRVERLRPGELLRIPWAGPIVARGRGALGLDARLTGRLEFGHGAAFVNAGAEPWRAAGALTVAPRSHAIVFAPGLGELRPLSRAGDAELSALFLGQATIILRELLFKGRALDSNRWLGRDTIALEDHDRW